MILVRSQQDFGMIYRNEAAATVAAAAIDMDEGVSKLSWNCGLQI